MNVGVLLSESLFYLIQNGAWALVFLDPSQVRMCRQCWKILKLKKLGETVLRPVLLLASPVTLGPHFVELRVVNEKYLLVWKHGFVNLFPAYIYFFLRTWKFWWKIIPQMPFCPLCRKISHLCFFWNLVSIAALPLVSCCGVTLHSAVLCSNFLTLGPHLFVLF